MEELNSVEPHRLEVEPHLEFNTTAYWLRQRFRVSPLFFHHVQNNDVTWIGNASLIRTEAGKRVALGKHFYLFATRFKFLNYLISRRTLSGFFRARSSRFPCLVLPWPINRPFINIYNPWLSRTRESPHSVIFKANKPKPCVASIY